MKVTTHWLQTDLSANVAGMPKKDFSQIAFEVVRRATGEAPKPAPAPIKKAASPVKKIAAVGVTAQPP